MKVTHTIITECIPLLEVELEKLNKKAKRLGCTPLTLGLSDPYMRARVDNGVNVVDNVVDATIDGDPIKLNGWKFLGRVEAVQSAENLIFTVPGEKAPDEYRTCDAYRCQHCNQNRLRKYTWIVEHDDGRHMQVGSSCMDDFLSSKNPERAVTWWMGSMDKLLAYLRELEQKTPQHVLTGFNGINRPMLVSAYAVLIRACQTVRLRGRYEFDNDSTQGTPSRVWQAMFGGASVEAPTADDTDLADRIVSYAIARRATSDYYRNLSIMFVGDKVAARNIRYICSSVYSYQKAHRPAPQGKNEYFGAIGDRLRGLKLKVAFVVELTSMYHENFDYLIIMHDADGRTFVWKKTSAGMPPKKGEDVLVTGTVAKHEAYKGTNQTVLTRCKLEVKVAA